MIKQGKPLHLAIDMLGVCRLPWIELGFELDHYPKYFEAVTGVPITLNEMWDIGDRIYALIRAFWIREFGSNWTRNMDLPPQRWFKEPLSKGPELFIGAAANPFADPLPFRVVRLAKKISAGADFIQTQCIYNLDRFEEWMKMARDKGLTDKVFILGGVTPLKSPGMAKYMKNKVAGMDVPDEIIKRMEGVPKEKQREEGIQICVETIQQLKEMPGVKGVHIMAIEWEEVVGEIVEKAGLLPRPAFS